MKWLVLTLKRTEGKSHLVADTLRQCLAHHGPCEVRQLLRKEQQNLEKYFRKHVTAGAYERIILFLCLKTGIEQARFLRTVPNIVFMEYDAFENYLDFFWLYGRYSRFYRTMPWARLIVSGHGLARRLQQEGFDAVFLPKGYDHLLIKNLRRQRDIELGFIGNTQYYVYRERKRLLQQLAQHEKLHLATTVSGLPYLQYLNRIKFFVTADANFGEYMLKDFEAMACGCVLFAQDRGAAENQALGLRDMEHLVLYRSLKELREKLAHLRRHPEVAQQIAAAGEAFVAEKYSWDVTAARFVQLVQAPLREKPVKRFLGIPVAYPAVTHYAAAPAAHSSAQ